MSTVTATGPTSSLDKNTNCSACGAALTSEGYAHRDDCRIGLAVERARGMREFQRRVDARIALKGARP